MGRLRVGTFNVRHCRGLDDVFYFWDEESSAIAEAPADDPSRLRTLIGHRDDVRLEDIDAFSGQLVLSHAEHPEIQVLDSAGRVMRIIRWRDEGLALDDRDRELHNRGRVEFLRRYPDHAPLLPKLEAIPILPSNIPALWQIQSDSHGRLWIQTYPRYAGGRPTEFSMLGQSERSTWLIFDERGALIGRLSLPVGARLLDVAGDRLALLLQDDLDVQRVEVHALLDADERN